METREPSVPPKYPRRNGNSKRAASRREQCQRCQRRRDAYLLPTRRGLAFARLVNRACRFGACNAIEITAFRFLPKAGGGGGGGGGQRVPRGRVRGRGPAVGLRARDFPSTSFRLPSLENAASPSAPLASSRRRESARRTNGINPGTAGDRRENRSTLLEPFAFLLHFFHAAALHRWDTRFGARSREQTARREQCE